MRTRLLLTTALALASPAFAQNAASPGTEAGAKTLSEDIAAYVGRTAIDEKIVTVAPDAAGYRIAFDAQPILKLFSGLDATLEVSDWFAIVAPLPDGTWSVSSNAPLKADFSLTMEGLEQSSSYDYGDMDFSGVFSPELGTFLSGKGRIGKATMSSSDAISKMTATLGKTDYDIASTKAGDGMVDFTTTQTLEGFEETLTFSPDPATPDQSYPVKITATGLDFDGGGTSVKSRAVMDLWAFAIAHADEAKIKAAQGELKEKLRALLPLWDSFRGDYAFRDLDVETPVGTFRMKELFQKAGGDGIETQGRFDYAFGYTGLTVSSPMVPAWSASLIPTDFALALTVSDIDLDAPTRIWIEDFDLSRDEPISTAAGEKVLAHFTAKPPRLTIEPTRIKAADYELTMSGEMAFGAGAPETVLTIEATGLDKAIATLQAAGAADQLALQIVGPLSMAKGFAKPLPDGRSQWVVETASDGSVKLNGAQIKGPDAPPALPGMAPTDDNAIPPL